MSPAAGGADLARPRLMGWLSRYRRQRRRAQDARDALQPLETLLARWAFGWRRSERVVEIPWVLGKVGGAHRVLDIGFVHAPDEYAGAVQRQAPPVLVGLDLAPGRRPGYLPCAGDIRALPFRSGVFDLVILISTLEHVGMDNARYTGKTERRPATQGKALEEVRRVLRPGGRALVTVPFGRFENHGWFINYDLDFWADVLRASGFMEASRDTFGYVGYRWRRTTVDALAAVGYRGRRARAAAGVLCAELLRPASGEARESPSA